MSNHFLSLLLATFISAGLLSACETQSNNKNDIWEKEKTFAADTLLSEDGTFGNDSEGILRVGFIGGSLTDGQSYYSEEGYVYGGNVWTDAVCQYLTKQFPNRQVIAHNSGIASSTSAFGAMRIEHTIYDYDPDIVFIEFTVNDRLNDFDKELSQKYMESMVRMAQRKEKIPVLIFLYTPFPVDNNTEEYSDWKQGVEWKQEIADYYGIGSINVYDYLHIEYEKTDYPTFMNFLESESSYKGNAANGFNVHGGYEYYAAAILKAISERPSDLFGHQKIKREWFDNGIYKDTTYVNYRFIEYNNKRLNYKGNWTLYNISNSVTAPKNFGVSDWSIMQPTKWKNIMATTEVGASVSFTTDADAIFFNSQLVDVDMEMKAAVYVDGEYSKSFSCSMCELIASLDGQPHEIKIITEKSNNPEHLFLSVNYIEAYKESRITNQ